MREPTREPLADAGAGPGAGDGDVARATWARRVAAGVGVAILVAVVAVAYTPRTVAEGDGDRAWRVTVTPGIVSSTIRMTGPDSFEHRASGFGLAPPLDATQVWGAPLTPAGEPTTLVVGLTPPGVDSVRVTSDTEGVGEARIQRVAWRRVHVTVIESDARVEELVAISDDGRVLEAVSDIPATADPTR